MASILDKYGIKEVCDFTFYELDNGLPTKPVLYLDTLKVSTMEQTGEETEARGGKGNVALIAWDYNKEINFSLEDALFSAKSMAVMFGNGQVKTIAGDKLIMKSEVFTITAQQNAGSSDALRKMADMEKAGWNSIYTAPNGDTAKKLNAKFYTAEGTPIDGKTALKVGDKCFCTFDLMVAGSVIDISANSFPGTYYCTGDTFARSQADGKDEFFQLIIPKAKVTSENTITMEAEGDPSVFNMNLKVLRGDDGTMVRLVKYDLDDTTVKKAAETSPETDIVHNHKMSATNEQDVPAAQAAAAAYKTSQG